MMNKQPAKKSLGQHWLKEEKYLKAIASAGDIHADDLVLEIGPGQGDLTLRLLKLAGKVIAVEKDEALVSLLKEKFAKEITAGKLDIVEKDILDFDLRGYLLASPGQPLGNGSANKYPLSHEFPSYKIIANIPYYITGAILKKFLTTDFQPAQMVLLVQKEVAERIFARDGKESILSVSVKAYSVPGLAGKVPRGSFSPPPKVDSAILKITGISKNFFTKEKIEEKTFFRVVRVGFSSKRKTLRNNLGALFGRKEAALVLKQCQIAENIRAERLSLADWACLTREFTKIAKK